MGREGELLTVPARKARRRAGDRKDVWSLSVTRNRRLTCRIDQNGDEIVDLDDGNFA